MRSLKRGLILTAISTSGLFLLKLRQEEANTEWREIYGEMGQIQEKGFTVEGILNNRAFIDQGYKAPSTSAFDQLDVKKIKEKSGIVGPLHEQIWPLIYLIYLAFNTPGHICIV